jgi:nucleoid-associated protein YgaU
MGLFNFVKDAGENLGKAIGLGGDDTGDLKGALQKYGVTLENLTLDIKGSTAIVTGVADTQAEREKAILVLGNVKGIDAVQDTIRVKQAAQARPTAVQPGAAGQAGFPGGAAAAAQPESKFYTVKSGDSLSKIAKEFYGEANKYPQIFEANKPMLSDPDKIYPGQTLRIPPER